VTKKSGEARLVPSPRHVAVSQSICDPLAAYLATLFGRAGLVLTGKTAVGKRSELVRTFQDDAGPPFFVVSVKAGGSGLNLTAASHVVHFDRWWNPAVENQATDRAFRIGQKRNVLVHKFVCRGTVEERIDRMIHDKQALADQVIGIVAPALATIHGDAFHGESDLGRTSIHPALAYTKSACRCAWSCANWSNCTPSRGTPPEFLQLYRHSAIQHHDAISPLPPYAIRSPPQEGQWHWPFFPLPPSHA
jgi:hypothetical protein